jgi:hypothetical protein
MAYERNVDEEFSWKRSFDGDQEELSSNSLFTTIRNTLLTITGTFANDRAARDSKYQLLNPQDLSQPSDEKVRISYLNQHEKISEDASIMNASNDQTSDNIDSIRRSRNYKLFHIGQASTTSCVLNLINTTIGSGELLCCPI